MATLLQAVKQHLAKHYPSLPPLDGDQIFFLIRLDGSGMGEACIKYIVDVFVFTIVDSIGTEILHIPKEHWSLEKSISSVYGPYQIVHDELAKATYKLCHKHNLSSYGTRLRFQKELPIESATKFVYHAIQSAWPLVFNNTDLLLNATSHFLLQPWDIKTDGPIRFRPTIYVDNIPHKGYTDEIIKMAFEGILKKLGIEDEWLPVYNCYYDGATTIQEVVAKTGLNESTVKYYNIRLLTIFKGFSEVFPNTKAAIDFLKKQGFPRG